MLLVLMIVAWWVPIQATALFRQRQQRGTSSSARSRSALRCRRRSRIAPAVLYRLSYTGSRGARFSRASACATKKSQNGLTPVHLQEERRCAYVSSELWNAQVHQVAHAIKAFLQSHPWQYLKCAGWVASFLPGLAHPMLFGDLCPQEPSPWSGSRQQAERLPDQGRSGGPPPERAAGTPLDSPCSWPPPAH